MRFHVVALPHTRTHAADSHCAYTQKTLKFCRMMRSLGHGVFHYGAEGSVVDCTEHVTVITSAEQEQFFGAPDPNRMPSARFEVQQPYWQLTNFRTTSAVAARQQRGDFLCLIAGRCQQPIAEGIGPAHCIPVEYGVGYYGTFARFRVFESYTHQAAVYGQQSMEPDGFLYDAVIPNFFDPIDFPFQPEKGNYLLFLARVVQRKGIEIALEVAAASGMRLVIAGQGVAEVGDHKIVTEDGRTIDLHRGAGVEYVGSVGPVERARLMGGARALIQPTIFMEPFGGNVVEAAMCGTPAITTDYAAFSETVRHGVTGFRCHTLEQFVWATRAVQDLDPAEIRRIAVANYSMERVGLMYREYFEMLYGLWGRGWPELKTRTQLDWLSKA